MDKQSISLIIPAYNEEANIEIVISKAIKVLRTLFQDFEVIIVDDGSFDQTKKIVNHLIQDEPRIKLISHHHNLGYGAALNSGILAARKDLVFLTDADDQFDFSEIGKLLHFIPAYDGVIGYRFNRRDPIIRILLAKAWNWLNGLLFGLKFRDINCAFKLFKKSTVQNIGIKSKGAFISAELLIRLVRNGYKVKEVPVKHFPRREGVATGAKFRVIVKAFYEIFILFPELAAITHRQLVKYSIIGIINTFLDWGVYLGLTRIFAYFIQHYLFAKGISFCVAVTNSYFWNRYWTFRSKRKEILRQYSISN
jgi:glycosyltransferase involved in cell wall biosynthesis